MIALYSYPELFGVADNNPFGLKIYAFLKLCGLDFRHEHIVDASAAPRGQLPYIVDDGETIGDSDTIIAHLIAKHGLAVNAGLSPAERVTGHMLTRTLDDLYWVMSYSRWRDPAFWPLFEAALLREHPALTEDTLKAAQAYNSKRYYYQGIGRFEPDDAYARGLADIDAAAACLGERDFLFGPRPSGFDAGLYGFIANMYFFDIDTPLKRRVCSHPALVRHCRRLHEMVSG